MTSETTLAAIDSARSDSRRKIWIWISIATACLLIGSFFFRWRGMIPFEGWVRVFARMDAWDQALPLASNPESLRRYYSWSLGTVFSIAGLFTFARVAWVHMTEESRKVIYNLTVTLTCSCALMLYLLRMEFDAPWLPIANVMRNPSAFPIYGHRLLFVWIAKAFQSIVPNLSDTRDFYLSQFVASFLAMYALGKWSALHIGSALSWMGQVIGVLMISTCFGYYNFYDIGTVFFATCGLLAIYTRKYWLLVPVVAVGTLNYEGLLLLIPIAAFMAYGNESAKKWVPVVAASLLAYCTVRFALQVAVPFPHHFDLRVWSNMTKPFIKQKQVAGCVLALGGWYGLGLMSLRYCDRRLKRLTLLFPLLFGVTFLFGQLHEARQFDAFIPVVIATILSASKRRLELETHAAARGVG
jgi:hypothetical protein